MINHALCIFVAFLLFHAVPSGVSASVTGCVKCHAIEVEEWGRSQHSLAMMPADSTTVAGDFGGDLFKDEQIEARFSREGDRFIIHLKEGGETRIWQVQYTFGIYPLQQYLIDVGSGRLQAFNIAWDNRPASAGGQRWFRLDESGQNHPGDAMHWTGVYQNWNNQCADCHSSGLIRNYSSETDSYNTRWNQMSVGCPACHTDGEAHAAAERDGTEMGAGIELAAMGAWLVSNSKEPPRHTGPTSSPHQVTTCGRCHSLRTSLADTGNGQVHDQFSLTRLDQPLYYSDGRVREEVFVLGSFEQSKMFQAGVVCTDCHNPHTGKLKAENNSVCTQCHNTSDFDTPKHHHHDSKSVGAQCVNCHMPETTFMKIDARREHSFFVPRPDIAEASGSPDVCIACHSTKSRDWSLKTVNDWFPELYRRDTWHDAQQSSREEVIAYLTDIGEPALRRATLLEQQGAWLMEQQPDLVADLAKSELSVIRESAFRVLRHGTPQFAQQMAVLGLTDPSLAVRLATFGSVTVLGVELESKQWELVRGEYEHYLDMQSDLPSGLVLKAQYLLARDFVYKAEKVLEKALAKDLGYVPAAILLTDILRAGGRNLEAVDVINRSLTKSSSAARLIHLRGLIRLRLENYGEALEDLERSAALANDQWLFGYRYAVALYRLQQKDKAREVTESLLERFPDNPQLKMLLKHL